VFPSKLLKIEIKTVKSHLILGNIQRIEVVEGRVQRDEEDGSSCRRNDDIKTKK